jgi:hypothetical protein
MIAKRPLCPERVCKMTGSFAFLAHRCVRDGFWSSRSQPALLLSVLLVVVAERHGLSYDSFETICGLVQRSLDADLMARHALIQQELIAFAGPLFQVLSLPPQPVLQPARPLHRAQHMAQADPATLRRLSRDSLGANDDG